LIVYTDCFFEVNSINLRSATHEEAIQALRQSTNIIRLVVFRGDIGTEEDKFDLITVELTKRSGRGLGNYFNDQDVVCISFFFLGFSIIGRRHGCGVFISHIVRSQNDRCFHLLLKLNRSKVV
jgi:InaD-like protein